MAEAIVGFGQEVEDAVFTDIPVTAALAIVKTEVVQAVPIPETEEVTKAEAGNGSWGEASHHNLSNGARASGDVLSAHSLLGPADLDWDPEFAPLLSEMPDDDETECDHRSRDRRGGVPALRRVAAEPGQRCFPLDARRGRQKPREAAVRLLRRVVHSARAVARSGEPVSDPRYEYVRCETCGETFQRLDFRANPHLLMCANPKEPPLVEPKEKVTLRCPGCGAISDVQKKYAFRLNCTGCLLDKGNIVKLVEVTP